MMLSGRVAQPLVGLARLVQEYEEVNAAIGEAGAVLNRPLEIDAASGGLRPKFAGAISFQDVTFTYGDTGAATVNLAVEHGQEALDIGRVAGLDDDIEDQAASAGGQIELVSVLHVAAALDDVGVRRELHTATLATVLNR